MTFVKRKTFESRHIRYHLSNHVFLSDNVPSTNRPNTERAHQARQVRHALDTVPRGSRTTGDLRGDIGNLQLSGPQALHEKLQSPRDQIQADLLQHHSRHEPRGHQRFLAGQIYQLTVAHVGTSSRPRLGTDNLYVSEKLNDFFQI